MEDYKKVNLDSYNTNAKVFSEYFKGMMDFKERKEFSAFIRALNGKRVLDLGCGGGDHSVWFKEQGLDPLCVDFSSKMIELCKQKGLSSKVMDLENLEFDKNSFDGIWAVNSLLHVSKNNMNQVVHKLSEILTSRGILLVTLKEGEGERFVIDKLNPHTRRFFIYWKKEEFLKFFGKHFDLIDYWERKPADANFLCALFRKKLS